MDLGKLYTNALSAAGLTSDIILVSPEDPLGIIPDFDDPTSKGFLFDIIGEESINIQSDITDHFVENNSSLQDHIALKPETFTVSGYIGELNTVIPDVLLPLKDAVDRLTLISDYTPQLTLSAIRAYNTAAQLYKIASKAGKALKKLVGLDKGETAQSIAFNEFYNYWLDHQLFYVQTPWGIFSNMAIQSMRVTQSENDKNTSDFEIVFKKIRMAETKVTTKQNSARGSSDIINKGRSTPLEFVA